MDLQPHQQRVVAEEAELAQRLEKLKAFLDSPAAEQVEHDEFDRMQRQVVYMRCYLDVLQDRIAAFGRAPE